MDKKELRSKIITARNRLCAEELRRKSEAIAENLFKMPAYRKSKTVMFFLTFGSEVKTLPMVEETIKMGKQALAPKALKNTRKMVPSLLLDLEADLEEGNYGIPEPKAEALRPVDPKTIDLLMVPGVGFDMKGNRLGYGGGYYDRFFEHLRPDVPLVALAFELQIVERVPVEEWDRRVDYLITEQRVIKF